MTCACVRRVTKRAAGNCDCSFCQYLSSTFFKPQPRTKSGKTVNIPRRHTRRQALSLVSMRGTPDSDYLQRDTPATGDAWRDTTPTIPPTVLLADDQKEMLNTAALILEDDFNIVG